MGEIKKGQGWIVVKDRYGRSWHIGPYTTELVINRVVVWRR